MTSSEGGGKYARSLAGVITVLVLAGVVGLAIGLFRGSFTKTEPLTVISDRAGLVMNPDAKVKMRGVEIGRVSSIESRADGTAALHLAMQPEQLRRIPSNVQVDIASSTVFGAKFVQLQAPDDPSSEAVRPGDVLQGEHVTVEINSVFQQLTQVLDKIEPVKLNQTLAAISAAFNGRGEQFGKTVSDFNAFLAKIEPSLDTLERETAMMPPVFTAYADTAQALSDTVSNTTTLSNSIVDKQRDLDTFLLAATGLANVGQDVLGGNREQLTKVAQVLLPTAQLLDRYHAGLGCGVAGLIPFTKNPNFPVPGITFDASFVLGTERYRYPTHLPKVAARLSDDIVNSDYCKAYGLPEVAPEFRPPALVADIGADRNEYGNQGILLNSDGLKQLLYGPIAGPPRNSAQIGMPG
jgi:phospholipid/cholesterol/gamma-HCH transport system substrate-binding protein